MELEFKAKVKELRNAVKQILTNRDRRAREQDLVHLLVSETGATLRTTGTSVEIPVVGDACGAAVMPVAVIERIAKVAGSFNSDDVPVKVVEGAVKIATWKTNDGGIRLMSLRELPDLSLDLPVDASALDTLGFASLLTKEKIVAQGIKKRVDAARDEADGAILTAAYGLSMFGVQEEQIRALVEARIKEAGERIAKSLEKTDLVPEPAPKKKKRAAAGNQKALFD